MRRLLTLGQPHRNTAIRAHLQSRRPLALLVVLVLCLSVFILAANEAWAKEQPSPAAQQAPAEGKNTPNNGQANGKVAEPVSGTQTPSVTPPVTPPASQGQAQGQPAVTPPVQTPPVENAPPPPKSETPKSETPKSETLKSETPKSETSPPAEKPSSPPLEPAPSTPKPDPAPQVGAGGEEDVESDPVPHTSRPSTTDSNQVVEPKLVSTASPDVVDEVVHLAPARAPAPATPAAEVFRTLAGGSTGTPSSGATNGTQQAPSDGTLKQPAPLAPPPLGDGLFSPFTGAAGGQSGAGGGLALLLVGILALLTVSLARRDFRTYLIACEVPKPSSALLRPLERPG